MPIVKKLTMPPPEAVLNLWKLGREEWDNRLGDRVKAAANWRRAFFGTQLLLLFTIGLCGYLGAQPKSVPHVIEVDKVGAARYRGPIGDDAKKYTISEQAIRYHLRTFVVELRSISSDPAIIKANLTEALEWSTPAAQSLIAKSLKDHDPFKRSVEERVSVDVQQPLALSRDTWQAEWKETRFDPQGVELDSVSWRGTFRLVFRLTEKGVTEEMLEKNPLGIYIDFFDYRRL
jgi:type IV secretion system protein VirB5